MYKALSFFCSIIFLFLLLSCSLNYSNNEDFSETAPEFVFNNLNLYSVENQKIKTSMKAESFEQYSSENLIYAKKAYFTLYNSQNQIETEGTCDILEVDNDNEVYTLLSNVIVSAYEQDMQIVADAIKWNNKTEQLVSNADDKISLTSGLSRASTQYAKPSSLGNTKITLTGGKFSASGISRTYQFNSPITGSIITEDNAE